MHSTEWPLGAEVLTKRLHVLQIIPETKDQKSKSDHQECVLEIHVPLMVYPCRCSHKSAEVGEPTTEDETTIALSLLMRGGKDTTTTHHTQTHTHKQVDVVATYIPLLQ
jgi:hypothetical protein